MLVASGVDQIRISVNALTLQQYKEVVGVDLDFDKFVSNIEDLHNKAKGRPHIMAKIVDAAFCEPSYEQLFKSTLAGITDSMYVEKVVGFWQDYNFMPLENTNPSPPQGMSYMYLQEEPDKCPFPFTDMMIFSNGDVGLCCSDWKHSTKYGRILKDSLYNLQRSAALEEIRQQHVNMPRSQIEICAWCKKRSTGIYRS